MIYNLPYLIIFLIKSYVNSYRAENIYEEYDQFRAVITNTGDVHWEPGGVFKTMCEIDITYYPFDDQKCKLTFGAWSYHTAKMNLTNSSHTVNLDSYNVCAICFLKIFS